MEKRRPNRSLRNSDEVMDALVDDYFRYDELAQMEAEAIRMNIRKEETSMYEYVEVDPLNLPNDLTSDLDERHSNDDDGAEKENVPNKRFRMVTDDDTDKFLEESVNRNTKSKTKSDMKIITDFLSSVGEKRNPDEIPAKELDSIMARFFLGVLKKDGSEYEPDSLGSMFNSIDRYLRDLKSPLSVKKDPEFSHTRRVLEAKRKSLKSLGKGNKPNRAEALSSEEISLLREKGIIGTQNPKALLNAVFLNNGVYFGLRGRQDHVNMKWGDVQLKSTSGGKEYLEFNERSTKTRSGAKSSDYREVNPKVFEEGGEKCPVYFYKEYERHRPQDTLSEESRFYLRALAKTNGDVWYSHQTVGRDKLGKVIKSMAEKANLQGPKVNHSGRKTFATTLLQNGRLITEVAQLGGWKNVGTLMHYSVASIKQQEEASHTISSVMLYDNAEEVQPLDVIIDEPPTESDQALYPANSSTNTLVNANINNTNNQMANKHENPMSLFCGATVTGRVININVYSGERKHTINCSQ